MDDILGGFHYLLKLLLIIGLLIFILFSILWGICSFTNRDKGKEIFGQLTKITIIMLIGIGSQYTFIDSLLPFNFID